MPTLFGYSVDDDDGRLVITVHGRLAEEGIRRLHEQIDAGGVLPLPALLAPLRPLRGLLSASVVLGAGSAAVEGSPGAEEGDDILSQTVDQTLTEFRRQMEEFRTSAQALREREQEVQSDQPPP